MSYQQENLHIGENLKDWNFIYSNEFLKTDYPLIWEFPNIGDNRSEFMPQFLRLRMPGKSAKYHKKNEIERLKHYGNNGNNKYKIEFDEI